jgi:hypothetical protein
VDADVDVDDELGDDGERVLAVRPGAFPGSEGTLRLTFTDADDEPTLILDLPIPEPVELGMRPINEVREAQTPETTITTESTTSTTSPNPTFVPVPVPLPQPGATSSSSSSTTSSTSTTSTTSTTLP